MHGLVTQHRRRANRRSGRTDPRLVELVVAAVALAVLLGAYGTKLLASRSVAVNGCDSYAYLQGATVMAEEGPLHTALHDPLIPRIVESYDVRPPDSALIFLLSPHGHYVNDLDRGAAYNVFPPGMSWLLLAVLKIFGRPAVFLVLPLLNLAFAALLFLVAARHTSPAVALCAAVLVVGNGVVFQTTTWVMSDLPSMVLVTATAYLLFLNIQRARWLLPVAAGVCFGLSLTLRYSNAVAAAPLAVLFAVLVRQGRTRRQVVGDLGLFGVATLVFGCVPLALYTRELFGTVFRLVYEPTTMSHMRLAELIPGAAFYARSLATNFGTVGLGIAGLGLVVCGARRESRPFAVAAAVAVGAYVLFHAFHTIRHDRYLMPAYPWLALLYGFGCASLAGLSRRVRPLQLALTALLAAAPLWHSWARLGVGDLTQERTCRMLADRVEPDGVIFCDMLSGPVRLYAGLTGYRLQWTRPKTLAETCEIVHRLGRPVYLLLDSQPAAARFDDLIGDGILRRDLLVELDDVDGLPLWRYRPPALPSGSGAGPKPRSGLESAAAGTGVGEGDAEGGLVRESGLDRGDRVHGRR